MKAAEDGGAGWKEEVRRLQPPSGHEEQNDILPCPLDSSAGQVMMEGWCFNGGPREVHVSAWVATFGGKT